jgi:hypothetical protein
MPQGPSAAGRSDGTTIWTIRTGTLVPSEADTCRKFVVRLLQVAGWDSDPHFIAEQRTITDGRIVLLATKQLGISEE